jgi:hypothetical protein
VSLWQRYLDLADTGHGCRPGAGGAAPVPRLERAPDPDPIPASPCEGCDGFRRCAVLRLSCAAYREYVQTGARALHRRGKHIKPAKKFLG